MRILQPNELDRVGWSYAVLALAGPLAGRVWWKTRAEFRAGRGGQTIRKGLNRANDTTTVTVLFDSTASLVGLVMAFLGILLSTLLQAPAIAGVAPVVTGLIRRSSPFLTCKSHQLLVGGSARVGLKDAIRTGWRRTPRSRQWRSC